MACRSNADISLDWQRVSPHGSSTKGGLSAKKSNHCKIVFDRFATCVIQTNFKPRSNRGTPSKVRFRLRAVPTSETIRTLVPPVSYFSAHRLMRWEGVSLPLAHFGDLSIPMGVLLGDVNFTRGVDGNDVSAVQSHTRQSVSQSNCRFDVNTTGGIDGNDVSLTQSKTRTSLP